MYLGQFENLIRKIDFHLKERSVFRMSQTFIPKPPLRYFIGCILMAGISVFIEKDSHISSGGVTGLSIGIADLFHLNVGLVNLCIKIIIFVLVLIFGGKTTAFWTLIGAGLTALCMWGFALLPVDLDWPKWIAFGFILLFSKLPIGLLVSRGYSTGGFTSLGQILTNGFHLPLRTSLLCLNVLSILAMSISHGLLSGSLTAIIALTSGLTTEIWARFAKRVLDHKPAELPNP